MSKTTAVEWLVKTLELDTRFHGIMIDAINKAKEMEKEEIVRAFNSGDFMHHHKKDIDKDGYEYYNETYKGGQDA